MSALIGRAVAFQHFAKDQDFTGAKNIARATSKRRANPVPAADRISLCAEKPRIDEPSKVRLSADLQQKFLVIVQHVQAAFEVAKSTR